jgi:gluconate 2-dehydrogenase gamma chain
MERLTRRSFVSTIGAASIFPATSVLVTAMAYGSPASTTPKAGETHEESNFSYTFFNASEAAFIEAACECLIPADETGAGALAAGVPNYLDRQLGGVWGAGERLYRSGPWVPGTPSQGYQLPFTPAELFHTALGAIIRDFEMRGTPFAAMSAEAKDGYLKSLEAGGADLNGVPSGVFFDMLLKMTIEGFFSDPVYGGNRNMIAWRMIGFPGAYADYYDSVDRHGVKFEREPMSLGEDGWRHVHPDPNIPASL